MHFSLALVFIITTIFFSNFPFWHSIKFFLTCHFFVFSINVVGEKWELKFHTMYCFYSIVGYERYLMIYCCWYLFVTTHMNRLNLFQNTKPMSCHMFLTSAEIPVEVPIHWFGGKFRCFINAPNILSILQYLAILKKIHEELIFWIERNCGEYFLK